MASGKIVYSCSSASHPQNYISEPTEEAKEVEVFHIVNDSSKLNLDVTTANSDIDNESNCLTRRRDSNETGTLKSKKQNHRAFLNDSDLFEYKKMFDVFKIKTAQAGDRCENENGLVLVGQRRHFSAPIIHHSMTLNSDKVNSIRTLMLPKGNARKCDSSEPCVLKPKNGSGETHFLEPREKTEQLDKCDGAKLQKMKILRDDLPSCKHYVNDTLTLEMLLKNKLEFEQRRLADLEEENKDLWKDAILLTKDNDTLTLKLEAVESENQILRKQVELLQDALAHECQVSLELKEKDRFLREEQLTGKTSASELRESRESNDSQKDGDEEHKIGHIALPGALKAHNKPCVIEKRHEPETTTREKRRDTRTNLRGASSAVMRNRNVRNNKRCTSKFSFVISEQGRMTSTSTKDSTHEMVHKGCKDTSIDDKTQKGQQPLLSSLQRELQKESCAEQSSSSLVAGNNREVSKRTSPKTPPRNKAPTNGHPSHSEWGQKLQRSLKTTRDKKRSSESKMKIFVTDEKSKRDEEKCKRASEELNLLFTSFMSAPSGDTVSEAECGAFNEAEPHFESLEVRRSEDKECPVHQENPAGSTAALHPPLPPLTCVIRGEPSAKETHQEAVLADIQINSPDSTPSSFKRQRKGQRRRGASGIPPPFAVVTFDPSLIQEDFGSISWEEADEWSVQS